MENKELVELCKNGNEQALDLLYKTYADKMLKICSYYITDKQAAQDILHDGFIIIISSIHSLRSPNKLESWMGKIIRNLSLRYLEQCNLTATISLDEIHHEEEPIDYDYADEFPPYDTMLQLIEKLPKGYCKIFKLAVLEGLSHKEISSLLHIAPHSSSSQLSRAKEMLRKLFSQYRMIGLLALLSALSLYIFRTGKEKPVPKEQAKTNEWTDEVQQTENPFNADTISPDIPSQVIFQQVQDELAAADVTRKGNMANICSDSIIEKRDQFIDTNKKEEKCKQNMDGTLPNNIIPPYLITERNKNWILSISYSGATNQTDCQKSIIPGSITSGGPKEILEKIHHRVPVVFSLSAQKKINARWGIETGIQYTLLRSDFTSNDGTHLEQQAQKIHYLGIPLKGNFNIWKNGKVSFYTSAGLTLDVPIKASVKKSLFDNGQIIMQEKHSLHPSLQWSTSIGFGLQYQVTPTIGIYAEPNLHYYFNTDDGIKTIRTEKPLNVTLPIGIRLSW